MSMTEGIRAWARGRREAELGKAEGGSGEDKYRAALEAIVRIPETVNITGPYRDKPAAWEVAYGIALEALEPLDHPPPPGGRERECPVGCPTCDWARATLREYISENASLHSRVESLEEEAKGLRKVEEAARLFNEVYANGVGWLDPPGGAARLDGSYLEREDVALLDEAQEQLDTALNQNTEEASG